MYAVGNQVTTPKGLAIVDAINGGWTTVKFTDGKMGKFRNGDINSGNKATATRPAKPIRDSEDPNMSSKRKALARKTESEREGKATKAPKAAKSAKVKAAKAPKAAKSGVSAAKIEPLEQMRQACYARRREGEKVTLDNGDNVAKKLRGMSLDEVYKLASTELGVPMTELRAKYQALNPGMQRMNLGNRIRAALR